RQGSRPPAFWRMRLRRCDTVSSPSGTVEHELPRKPYKKRVVPFGSSGGPQSMSVKLSRSAYAGHYGPTVGDRIRLADTDLIIEIEKDHTVYGEEVVFGGGKSIRDGQGQ